MSSVYFLDTSDGALAAITVESAARWLDAPELERLTRYRPPEKQREFLLARYFVKSVLRELHGVSDPRLSAVEHQKPVLLGGGPRFSLSHSGGGLALIVSPTDEVGIDVEPVRPYAPALAEAALTEAERSTVFTNEAFFQVWTAKEAFMKRAGVGMEIEPRRLTVDRTRGLVLDSETGETRAYSTARFGRFVASWM